MKRLLPVLTAFIVFVFFVNFSIAQSKFDQGFIDAYKKGYCYEKANCISPIPPVAPIPTVSENLNSYQDGYSRGFKMGMEAQNGNTSGQKRYKTASADPVDYTDKPSQSEIKEFIAENKHVIFNKIMAEAQGKYATGNYTGCIKACYDAITLTKLVSKQCYNLMAKSYEALGKKGKAKKYFKKAGKMN